MGVKASSVRAWLRPPEIATLNLAGQNVACLKAALHPNSLARIACRYPCPWKKIPGLPLATDSNRFGRANKPAIRGTQALTPTKANNAAVTLTPQSTGQLVIFKANTLSP